MTLDHAQAIKINWKDPEQALTKLHPRIKDTEDEDSDIPVDAGSLFNLFEIASDPFDVSDLFPPYCKLSAYKGGIAVGYDHCQ